MIQVGKVTARHGEQAQPPSAMPVTSVGPRLLHRLPNPFGHGPVSLSCLGGRDLQRDREEPLIRRRQVRIPLAARARVPQWIRAGTGAT